jgi:gliding motility-associated-like protein
MALPLPTPFITNVPKRFLLSYKLILKMVLFALLISAFNIAYAQQAYLASSGNATAKGNIANNPVGQGAYMFNTGINAYAQQDFPVGFSLDKLGLTSSTSLGGAYSLRLLSSFYSGPLVRIAIGSSFYDVYPDASAGLAFSLSSPVSAAYSTYDAAPTGATGTTLSTIIGSNTATVAIWYDQTVVHNYNAIQGNLSAQPQIINAGTINTANGKPAIKFSGTQFMLVTTTGLNFHMSGSIVYNAASGNTNSGNAGAWYTMAGIVGSEQGGVVNDWGYGVYNNKFTVGIGNIDGYSDASYGAGASVNDGTTRQTTWTRNYSSGVVAIYNNGVAEGSNTLPAGERNAVQSFSIGSSVPDGSFGFTGTISEIALFPIVYNLTERQAVEGSQSTYYNITAVTGSISTSGTLSALTTTRGTASASTTFNVSGTGLSSGILIAPPVGFEVSTNNSSFSPTITVGTGGVIASTPVYIRLAASAAKGTYSGNIELSATGALPKTIAMAVSTVTSNATDYPVISYGTAKVFATNTAITPVVPTATNVDPFGYSSNFGTVGGGVTQALRIKKDAQGNVYLLDNIYPSKLFKFPADGSAAVEILTGSIAPKGFALDDAGNIYVADMGDNVVRKIEAGTGTITTLATGFTTAYSVAIGKNGVIYVADFSASTIKQVPAGGGTPVAVGTGFLNPTDVAVDAAGNVYVADQGNGKLKKIWITTDGHTEDVTDIRQPVAVAVDKADNIYVSDISNFRIYELPANGSGPQIIASGAGLQSIYGLDADAKGVVYAALIPNSTGTIITPSGGYFLNTKLPAGLSFDQTTGTISGTPTEASAAKDYIITAYNSGSSQSTVVNISVKSTNANLSTLAVTGATITPAFDAATIGYSASVSTATTSVSITPTVADAIATLSYNGDAVTSGSPITIALAPGDNVVPIIVTAESGVTKTYTITVNRAAIPTLNYGAAQVFAENVAITPIVPTATNVSAFGYSSNFGTVGGGVTQAMRIKKDAQGNVYLLDNIYPSKLFKFPADGSAAVEIPTGGPSPKGFALDDAGNIYVADMSDNAVRKIEAGTGTITTLATGFVTAYSVAVGKNGIVYVADFSAIDIKQIPAGGGTPVAVGTGFHQATDVAVDAAGNVYVADQANGKLKKIWITTDGHTEDVADIRQPVAVAVDKADNVFVSDISNFRIYELPANGSGPQIIASGSAVQNIYGLDADAKGVLYAAQIPKSTGTVITPSGGYFLNTKLPAGLSFDQTTGIISGTPTQTTAAKDYIITAYSNGGSTSATVNIGVIPDKARLTALTVTGATINPAFDENTTTYNASISKETTSVTITPTAADAGATIAYNGNAVVSGSPVTVTLVAGNNSIPFIVTAVTGNTKTYTINVFKGSVPTVSYGTAQTFVLNTAITPITPAATHVGTLGYTNPLTDIGSGLGIQTYAAVVDDAGNTYLMSNGRRSVQVIPANGDPSYDIGGDFNFPSALAIDKANNLYIADISTIYKVAAGTTVLTPVGTTYGYVTSLTPDNEGNLYVADQANPKISKLNISDGTSVNIGSDLGYPTAVQLKGNKLYVLEGQSTKVFSMNIDGSNLTTLINYTGSHNIIIDPSGYLYAVSNGIIRYNLDGTNPQVAVSGSGDTYRVSVDKKGNIYIGTLSGGTMKLARPSGGYFIDKALPAGLNFDSSTGTISGTPTAASPATNYTIIAYNAADSISTHVTIGTASSNANLSSIVLNAGALSPAFDENTIAYTSSVRSTVTSIDITPVVADAGATITYNGSPVVSGSPVTVTLVAGNNSIPFIVTAGMGNTKTYTINISKAFAPTISYGIAQTFVLNTAITPITPTATHVGTLGYTNPLTDIGSGLGIQTYDAVVDDAGNTYLLSNGRRSIQVIPANGDAAYDIGGDFNFPSALAIDKANNLYVADMSTIYKVAPGSTVLTPVSTTYGYVTGLTPDNEGNLYVADQTNPKISKLNISDGTSVNIGSDLGYPTAVQLRGNKLYVLEGQSTKVFSMNTDGSDLATLINYTGSHNIIIDPSGYLYAVSNGIIRYNLDGTNPQVAVSGSGDTFRVGVDKKGNIYIGTLSGGSMKLARPSGGYFIDKALPPGLNFDISTGTISGTPTAASPATNYTIIAYNGTDSISTHITIGTEANNNLANLVTDAGTLTPMFDADSTSYKISVDNGILSTNITATLSEISNVLTINGVAATSGMPASAALNVGDNNIPVVITSPLDNSTKTYTVKIHRVSNDYKLSNLISSAGTFSPSFDADVTDYTVDLPYGTSSAKLTPTGNAFAVIKVDNVITATGIASQDLSLQSGDNNIVVNVAAEDGISTNNYTVNLRVAAPSSVSLSGITLSAGTLNPAFNAGSTNYQVSVPVGTSTIAVQPVLADALSVVTVNGSALDVMTGSVNVPLNDGLNVIAVNVVANDGTTTRSYTITVNKLIPAPTNAAIAAQVYKTGTTITPLNTGFGNVGAPGYFVLADTINHTIPTPTGIAINKAGDLFVADITAGSIYKLPVGGGAPVAILTGLNTPLGVATDADGNVYAAALGNTTIKKVTPEGVITNLGNGLSFPTGLTVDAVGNIYVNETANHAVKKVTPAGITTTVTTALSFPYGITVDGAGNIYVADNSEGSIVKFGPNGEARTELITGLVNPTDVKLDAEGNIYVNDGGANTLTKFDKNGANPVVISTGYTGLFGLAVGRDGKLYTTDNGKQSVNKLTPSGGYYLSDPLPDGLVFDSATGTISGIPTSVTVAKNYTITAYNSGGSTASVVNISVLTNANLANLALSTGTLNPVFDSGTINYTATANTPTIKLTPTAADNAATIKINGTPVANAEASDPIALNTGANNVTVTVTARDGVTTKTYTVKIGKGSNNASLAILNVSPSKLVPTSNTPGLVEYTTITSLSATSMVLTPTLKDANATLTINGVPAANGVASSPVALNPTGVTIISIVVTAQDGVTTRTYNVAVSKGPSNDASLATLSGEPNSKLVMVSNTAQLVEYSTITSLSTSSFAFTPTLRDANATLTINGAPATSGVASTPVTLNPTGVTNVSIIVTAQDGVTTRTYNIAVTKGPSADASLATLSIDPKSKLTVASSTAQLIQYTTLVGSTINSIMLTPTLKEAHATMSINGSPAVSGAASAPIPVRIGTTTTVNIVVTAEDGITSKTYSVVITRAPSNDATLAILSLDPKSKLVVASSTTELIAYTTTVEPATASITLTPTLKEANATVTINGLPAVSGVASSPIALNTGANTITIVVTAQDGITTRTYTVTVTRLSNNLAVDKASAGLLFANKTANAIAPTNNDGVVVHQGVSPNGDGSNDFLSIEGIAAYPNNRVSIMNTNGALVFEARDYGKDGSSLFNGHSNKTGAMLKAGTYFYQIEYKVGKENKRKTGYIVLKY